MACYDTRTEEYHELKVVWKPGEKMLAEVGIKMNKQDWKDFEYGRKVAQANTKLLVQRLRQSQLNKGEG